MKNKEKELLKIGENGWFILTLVLPLFTAIAVSLFGWWALLWAGLPLMFLTTESFFKYIVIWSYNRKEKLNVLDEKGNGIGLYLSLVAGYSFLIWLTFKVIPIVVTNPRIDWGLTIGYILFGILGLFALGMVIFGIACLIKLWIDRNRERAEELLGKGKVK